MTLTISCGLWASLSPCGLRVSLRVTGVSAGYGRLCGLRASLWVTGVSTGGWRRSLYLVWLQICQLCNPGAVPGASLRVADVALSTNHGCGSASSATMARSLALLLVTGLSTVYGQLSLIATLAISALATLCLLRQQPRYPTKLPS
jgi:hypothetical protein